MVGEWARVADLSLDAHRVLGELVAALRVIERYRGPGHEYRVEEIPSANARRRRGSGGTAHVVGSRGSASEAKTC